MAHHWSNARPPTLEEFEALAQLSLEALPEKFVKRAQDLVVRVTDFPRQEFLDSLQIEDPYELTGLYEGIPLTEKSSLEQAVQPDIIYLFRHPILHEWLTRGNQTLGDLVLHVMVHELAHHFGWSDADIAAIDNWMD